MILKKTLVLLSLILDIGFVTTIDTHQNNKEKETAQLSTKLIKLLNSGDELFKEGKYTKALEIYNKVMKQEAVVDPMYYDLRAICYLKTGDLEKALTEFKRALDSGRKMDILDAPSFAELGSKFRLQSQYDKGLWCYSRGMEIDPSNWSCVFWRASCNRQLENFDEAISDFRKAIRLDPNARDLPNELADLVLELEEFDDNMKEMVSHLSTDRLVALGLHLMTGKRFEFDEALYCFNTALEKDPNHSSIHRQRGRCYIAMHRPNDAIADFREALKLDPQDLHTLYKLIETLFSIGEFEKAFNELRTLDEKELVHLANHFISNNRFESALLVCNASIERYHSEASFYLLRGKCYMKMKEDNMANFDFAMMTRILQPAQTAQTSDPEKQLTSFYNFTELILSIGHEHDVRQAFLSLLDEAQLFELAKRFLTNNRIVESRFVCDKAIEIFPNGESLRALRKQIYAEEYKTQQEHIGLMSSEARSTI